MADTEDTETLAATIAPDVYEAYRLGRAGKQEYLDDWYSRAEDSPLPDVEIMRLAETILASSWLLARDERIRADEREKLAAEVEALAYEVSAPSWLGHDEIAAKIRALTSRLAGEVEVR